jgi:hypothetical protein
MELNNDLIISGWRRADAERFKREVGDEGRGKIGEYDAEVRDGKIFINSLELIPEEDRTELIKRYWQDPKTTGGRDRLYARIREKNLGISRNYIMETLRTFESWKQRQPVKKRKIIKPIITTAPNQLWQIDFLTLSGSLQWENFRYVLVVVDCFSKYVWAWPSKTKDAVSVAYILQELFKKHKPIKLLSDNGGEFKNNIMKTLCAQHNVVHETGLPYTPQIHGQVERVNRVIRDIVSKLYLEGKRNWPEMLGDIVQNINTSVNNTTKKKPVELYYQGPRDLEQDRLVIDRNIKRARALVTPAPKFHLGETVRIANPRPLGRLTHPIQRWGTKDFRIDRVIQPVNPWEQEQFLLSNGRIYTGYDLLKVEGN